MNKVMCFELFCSFTIRIHLALFVNMNEWDVVRIRVILLAIATTNIYKALLGAAKQLTCRGRKGIGCDAKLSGFEI